jgi:hypothetical protein
MFRTVLNLPSVSSVKGSEIWRVMSRGTRRPIGRQNELTGATVSVPYSIVFCTMDGTDEAIFLPGSVFL